MTGARRAALAACLALVASGCGYSAQNAGPALTVYSLSPLRGAAAERSRDLNDGEKLALAESSGQIGGLTLSFRAVDDAGPDGRATPATAAFAGQLAVRDVSIIAAIGDVSVAATETTEPLLNSAGALQVSPATTYAGLTGPAAQALRPSGRTTFARVIGADGSQASALAKLARRSRCRSLAVVSPASPSAAERSLAGLVAAAARRAGLRVGAASTPARAASSCAFLADADPASAAAAFRRAHRASPAATLLGSAALVDPGFARALGPAAGATRLVSPAPAARTLGPAGRAFSAAFSRAFGREPGPYAVMGYDAMRGVIAAIRRAGPRGGRRDGVVSAYMGAPRPSLLGEATTTRDGETAPARWFGARVAHGNVVAAARL